MRKVVVFVSAPEAALVRDAIVLSGGNKLGNYTESMFSTGSYDYTNAPRVTDEEKIEFACDDETYATIVSAIDEVVPRPHATVDSWSLETYHY